jgi:hypothetical protein
VEEVNFLRGRIEFLETLTRSNPVDTPDSSSVNFNYPVIQTMRRPWSEIKKELELKEKKKVVTPNVTTAIEELEAELLGS